MKHFTKHFAHVAMVGMMSLTSLSALADVVYTGKTLDHVPDFIPSQFTSNGKAVLFLEEGIYENGENYGEANQYKYTIFDGDFTELSSFTTPIYPKVTATYHSFAPKYGVVENRSNEYPEYWGTEEGVTEDEFISKCQERGCGRRVDKGSEIWMTHNNESGYFDFENHGYEYPEVVYIFRDGAVYCKVVEYDYDYDNVIGYEEQPTGETEDSKTPTPIQLSIKLANVNELDGEIALSQTLFNGDDAFEWIVPKYSAVDYNEIGYDNTKYEGQRVLMTGFKVVSQNGSTIADVDLPSGYNSEWPWVYVYVTEKGVYLLVECETDNEYYVLTYKIDPTTSSIQSLGAPRKVSVNPTTPRRGTPVNVSLGEPVGNNCKLAVVSVSGRTAMAQNLQPGATEAVIDTNRLESGVYVVVVDNGKTKRETTKIIVR